MSGEARDGAVLPSDGPGRTWQAQDLEVLAGWKGVPWGEAEQLLPPLMLFPLHPRLSAWGKSWQVFPSGLCLLSDCVRELTDH